MFSYKMDVLEELKKRGYTTYVLRKEKYLSQTTLANLRHGKPLNIESLNAICVMLRKPPEDILSFSISDEEKVKYFI